MEQGETNTSVQWKWIVIGALIGVGIVCISYLVVAPTFHSMAIQMLVMMVGFVLMGVIVGYFSPGVTIREAAYAGVIAMAIIALLITVFDWELGTHYVMVLAMLLFSGILSLMGGWIGEKMQGTIDKAESPEAQEKFQTKWVIAGVGLGLVLNVLFVFLLPRLFNINLNMVSLAFSASFVLTGFIVGYKSPGVTLKEPALAGVIAILLEWLFIEFAMSLTVPTEYVVFGIVEGFLLTLFGAWIGERYQLSKELVAEEAKQQ